MKIIRTIPSEATIQAELYMRLSLLGYRVILEQVFNLEGEGTRFHFKKPHYRRQRIRLRADIVILDKEDNAIAIIEVKNTSLPRNAEHFKSNGQYSNYVSLGIPFTYCTHMDQIEETIAWVKSIPALGAEVV